ncbi:BZ3500_MvSof-1268-A1-R1_Chr9g10581 [Microbotryum saponariae]|uniref:GDT1 family protein n=1 Tax=Microbotryum saponariae TaxID=289078 RepID=A0A2X0LMS2_9BASI|nr:BZ3501_MvSof-1269-A2-R1_Chr9g10329 [Microbotryum saponariae]SDA00333.1 BZ3500_MvSof-1268-A1-R1_Chr9g10581 [Microbotryum saponariae]
MFEFEGIPSLAGLDRAIAVIVVSEIGDKTFLIAAILSMRHPRVTIFAGALAALAVMSLLSSLLGQIVPTLLPKRYTTIAAALLFFVFGARMMQEGLEMEAGDAGRQKMEEEMKEVQKEVEEAEEEAASGNAGRKAAYQMVDLEETRSAASSPAAGLPRPVTSSKRRSSFSLPSKKDAVSTLTEGVKNLFGLFFSPIFVQAFILTFLAEWGDRSQITTIALAAAHVSFNPPHQKGVPGFLISLRLQNVWLVTFGTTLGHSFCTLLAVLGGRWISQHISIKHGTFTGATLFLIFGLIYSYEAYNYVDDAVAPLTP